MLTQEFQQLFCDRFGCQLTDYEEQMFRRCLYWHAKLIAPLLRRLKADFFAEDLKFVRYLGASTALREISQDLMTFRDANLARRSFWRTVLRLRVSGRKAARLARKLFAQGVEK